MGAVGYASSSESPNVVWAPLPGSQVLFLTCPVEEALYEGTRGPGKTESLLMSFGMYVGKGFGSYWRGIIFRQTYKQLTDLIVKSQRLFRRIFPGAKFNKSSHVWIFPGGEELLLRQMKTPDDYWDYHGHEYPFIGWEEITSWPTNECYEVMKSCFRSPFPGMPRMLRATTNPFGVGHRWVKEHFILPGPRGSIIRDEQGNRRVAIHGNVMENLYLLKNDPEYIRRLDAIKDPNVRAAWRNGSWEINAGGAVDDVWNEQIIKLPNFDVPPDWPIKRSFDWGSARPFSVGWHATSNGEEVEMPDGSRRSFPPGSQIRVAELYGSTGQPNVGLKWTNRRIAQEIVAKEVQYGIRGRVTAGAADSAIFSESTGYDKSIYMEMCEEGVEFLPAPKGPGSRRRRLSFLRSALSAAIEREGPGLWAMERCTEFFKQIPMLPRDEDDYECVDSDCEDHLYDELTYELSTCSAMQQAFQLRIM